MFETPLTVIGNIVNDLQRRRVGDQDVLRFRVASNSRRRTADGSWEPGNSLFISVTCWGRLVGAVGGALGKGSPVIVVGYIYTSEYEDRDGNRRSSLEMRATSVGADLARLNGGNGKPAQSSSGSETGQQAPEPAVQADTQADTQAETPAEAPAETVAEAQAETVAETPAETPADTDAESRPETEPESQPQTQPPQSEPQPEPGRDEAAGGQRDAGAKRKGFRLSA